MWKEVSIASLVWFRILFGGLMLFGVIRFASYGWIEDLYISPKFYFTFYGFEWVTPLTGNGMYWVFIVMGVSALLIILGLFYKIAIFLFFLSFTYVELIDKTNYLNHYYFISLVAFLMIFLPANKSHSLDVKLGIVRATHKVPAWTINILKFQLGIVYFFAGVAKLNYHWLVEAQPLSNWLNHQTDLPVIGGIMDQPVTAYIFSWAGCFFDLSVAFFLSFKKTRIFAYLAVVFFHFITGIMFPIGIFPWAMIVLTTIFFSSHLHEKLLSVFGNKSRSFTDYSYSKKLIQLFLIIYIFLQLVIPFRYLLYPGKLFWTEEGFRFSWRVMLIEKVGYCTFYISPENSTAKKEILPSDYLTDQQIKQMSTQPDMILQFAHFLRDEFKDSCIHTNDTTICLGTPKVFVDARVTLFNKASRVFVDPMRNLAEEPYDLQHREWIIPYE